MSYQLKIIKVRKYAQCRGTLKKKKGNKILLSPSKYSLETKNKNVSCMFSSG